LLFNGAVSVYGVDDGMINEYEVVGGMKIDRGNRSTGENQPHYNFATTLQPQTPQDVTWNRNRAAAVGSSDIIREGFLKDEFYYLKHETKATETDYMAL
jgi:hypothetical protein